jgi:hypothetical protein
MTLNTVLFFNIEFGTIKHPQHWPYFIKNHQTTIELDLSNPKDNTSYIRVIFCFFLILNN